VVSVALTNLESGIRFRHCEPKAKQSVGTYDSVLWTSPNLRFQNTDCKSANVVQKENVSRAFAKYKTTKGHKSFKHFSYFKIK
jgi:hypothetical protein